MKRGKRENLHAELGDRLGDVQRPKTIHPLTRTALQVALLLRTLALTEGSSTVAYPRITAEGQALRRFYSVASLSSLEIPGSHHEG